MTASSLTSISGLSDENRRLPCSDGNVRSRGSDIETLCFHSERTPSVSCLPVPPTIPAAFAAQSQDAVNKLVPIMSCPSVAMWQFMPHAAVGTSQDHVLHPPAA